MAIAPSPDSRLLALDRSGALELVDLASGRKLTALRDDSVRITSSLGNADVSAVSFHPNGRLVANLAHRFDLPGVALIWDLDRGAVLHRLKGHTKPISALAFNPDGSLLATAGHDSLIKLWDTSTGTERATLSGHQSPVRDLAWGPNGLALLSAAGSDESGRLASAGTRNSTGEVFLWDVPSRLSRRLEGLSGPVQAVAFHPSKPLAVAGSGSGVIALWDVSSGRLDHTLTGLASGVESLSFSHDGRRLVVAAQDQILHLFELTTGQEVLALSGHPGTITDVTFSLDGQALMSVSAGPLKSGELRIWDTVRAHPLLSPLSPEAQSHWHEQQLDRARMARSEFASLFHLTRLREVRPRDPELAVDRGAMLATQQRWDDAAAEFRAAIALKPDFAKAHYNLGNILKSQGDPDKAIAAYEEAIRLKPDFAEAHYNLGNIMKNQGERAKAIAAYREAIRFKPDFAEARTNLGNALRDQGELEQAIIQYREAIRLEPTLAEAHINLAFVLYSQGKLEDALTGFRDAAQFAPPDSPIAKASSNLVRRVEQQIKLIPRLAGVLSGDDKPRSAVEALAFARLCYDTGRYTAAARLWTVVLAAERKLGDDRQNPQRYIAACAAALAGCGKDQNPPFPGDSERAHLRKQALAWLKAELVALSKEFDSKPQQARSIVGRALRRWVEDPDLLGLRGKAELARLPEGEQAVCRAFWAEVTHSSAGQVARTGATSSPQTNCRPIHSHGDLHSLGKYLPHMNRPIDPTIPGTPPFLQTIWSGLLLTATNSKRTGWGWDPVIIGGLSCLRNALVLP